MNYDWDQTYIVDGTPPGFNNRFYAGTDVFFKSGMTTIEHPLPIPVLYDDIINLFALSGTGSTPTHIVNYGGVMGEQYIWSKEDIPGTERCVQFAGAMASFH